MSKFKETFQNILKDYARKAFVAGVYLLTNVVAAGTLPQPWNAIAAAVLAIVGTVHVYSVSNAPTPPKL